MILGKAASRKINRRADNILFREPRDMQGFYKKMKKNITENWLQIAHK